MTALAKVNAWSIAPTSLGELMQFAKLIADSELVPKDYRNKPGNCVIVIQMGADLGLSPMQAIQSIAVINGRASMWGDTLMAVVQASPECEDVVETFDRATMTATCVAKRRGRSPKTTVFSQEDAKRAGLWGKQGPWTQFPQRMLQLRARTFALRDQFPDVLRGIQSAEEQRDIIEVKATLVEPQAPVQEPEPKQLTAANVQAEPEEKHRRVWALYKNSSVVGQPITSIPDDKLASYIERLEKTANDRRNEKTSATADDAQLYLVAAREEHNERERIKRELEAEQAGADPETGELPHSAEATFFQGDDEQAS